LLKEAKKLASFFAWYVVYLCAMHAEITAEGLLATWPSWQIVDVRSEGEFAAGHIPGAINIPLFSDEERARVGTLYKQVSPDAALKEGLAIAGKKMNALAEEGQALANVKDKKLLVHCWRGGKRSEAVEWLFRFAGLEVSRLTGGYKAYRDELHSFFQKNEFRFNIIGGTTGSGKTEILSALHKKGEQVIDLERMAHHKGSAFGSIGELPQPTTEQFENDLFYAFHELSPKRPVWLENESKNIGRVYVPEGFWRKMRNSVLYDIQVSRPIRLQRILSYYAEPFRKEELKASFANIQKRLGGLEYQEAIKALDHGDLQQAAAIALHYYDKSYSFQLSQWPAEKVIRVEDCDDVEKAANQLILLRERKTNIG
jgi:tRNA 2-selenouridine synthase